MMAQSASIPFPEDAERRASISRDIRAATGLDEATLERVVRTFYASARQDEMIGHLFVAVQDWEVHIATITAFWSSVTLMTGCYHGQPLAAHVPLALEPPHFTRWLVLFEQAARELCTEEGVALLMEKARRIARSLQIGLGRNEFLLRHERDP